MDPSIALIVLKSQQPERVKQFYECLGIRFRTEKHGSGPVHFAAQVGETILELYPLPIAEHACDSQTRLGFRVDHAEQVVGALQAAGLPVLKPTTATAWGMRTVVQDPDGRSVEVYGRSSDAAA